MAAVIKFPLEPVTPIVAAGQDSRNRSISGGQQARRFAVRRPARDSPGRTAGLTTTRSARRKSSSRCPPRWKAAIGHTARLC